MTASNSSNKENNDQKFQTRTSPSLTIYTNFSSDSFLANRRHITLDELKKELTTHLKSLKSELVEMINRDYASFVDLSTNLKGVDKVIEEVARPLGKMREEVQEVRTNLQNVIDSLENQLFHRTSIREKKAALQLLINIHESVRKVENLLLISSESTSTHSPDESNVKQIERVAIEYNQMQYLVSKGKGLPFVENIDWRITRIKETLRINLSSALRSALSMVKNNSNISSSKETLTQILRTYALIDQTKSAEEVIREELIVPFIQEKILKGTSFEILVNSVWTEVVDSITKKIPIIFNSDVHYKLESMCTSRKSLLFLRNHPSYVEFMKRWQLPVYFQLRFKEISSQVEEVLNSGLEFPVDGFIDSQDPKSLILLASKSIFSAIERCWADDVFIYGLSHRFWKLTLQLVQRYKNWLMPVLTELIIEANGHNINEGSNTNGILSSSNSGGRVGSPAPNGNNNAFNEAQDDLLLKRLTIVAHDIENITMKIKEFYYGRIVNKLPESMTDLPIIEESIVSVLSSLKLGLPDFSQKITFILTNRCTDNLRLIRSIITQYRQPNTKPPTEASYFVPHIIKPLATFCHVNRSILSVDRRQEWCYSVGNAVSMRKSKGTRSLASSLFSKNNVSNDTLDDNTSLMSVEDKIRIQVLLDVKQFGIEVDSEIVNKIELDQYWLIKATQLPIFCKITFDYIWLPVSSCSVERSFSMYNSLLDSNRLWIS
ncbi:2025_t:CDS:10 [Diversispora eburnea]|uniref:Conserved oligomeric Golgi complex subunit 2 n=1 Tax=Diversispora eburnea TaxID=1213867 RepID=A0A9N8ZL64_9GLOM|nr:2025_t:CDS:10 [Diversispora eburnea]